MFLTTIHDKTEASLLREIYIMHIPTAYASIINWFLCYVYVPKFNCHEQYGS